MSDTAMTSFLGSCLDLLQTLLEVKVYFHSQLSELFNSLTLTGPTKALQKYFHLFISEF